MAKNRFFSQSFTFPQSSQIIVTFLISLFLANWAGFVASSHADDQTSFLNNCGEGIDHHRVAWPDTDFKTCIVSVDEIMSGGPGKDGIPTIDDVYVRSVDNATELTDQEPVISMTIEGKSRAWPLRYLIWHEIANDTLGGVPISVTYCPLCNAAIVFDRRIDDTVLDFGTTGNLRKSDLVMYDRQTESWWQQFTGQAIIGARAGQTLTVLASRLEDWKSFKTRNPNATVMGVQDLSFRSYGANPYRGYDTSPFPFLYNGKTPANIEPLTRVVVVDDTAWSLALIRNVKTLKIDGLIISWKPGQNSALDTREISSGRDVGTVTVRRKKDSGSSYEDVPYDVTFAFVFYAFKPEGEFIFTADDVN